MEHQIGRLQKHGYDINQNFAVTESFFVSWGQLEFLLAVRKGYIMQRL